MSSGSAGNPGGHPSSTKSGPAGKPGGPCGASADAAGPVAAGSKQLCRQSGAASPRASPYLPAPAGQRPHGGGQVLHPAAVHGQSRLVPGAAARQVGVVVLLSEPLQSHVGGRASTAALPNAVAWLRKLKHAGPCERSPVAERKASHVTVV